MAAANSTTYEEYYYDNGTVEYRYINCTEFLRIRQQELQAAANTSEDEGGFTFSGEIRIPLYSLIFLLSVVGNGLVILTLVQNKRMRTVTNVFLLNLAVADLMLSVFCMPITLLGNLLENFIFGSAMCSLIPYLQAMSVAVSVFTLVAISMERYFAICQPLRSMTWQTLSHSYRTITFIWFGAACFMVPTAMYSELIQVHECIPRYKCRENWPDRHLEIAFTVLLDLMLLVVPLVVMLVAYTTIAVHLYQGIRIDEQMGLQEVDSGQSGRQLADRGTTAPVEAAGDQTTDITAKNGAPPARPTTEHHSLLRKVLRRKQSCPSSPEYFNRRQSDTGRASSGSTRPASARCIVRQSNAEKSLAAKKRVIKMLFMIVLEFFICWTPLYVINTWLLVDKKSLLNAGADRVHASLILLLAYCNSCTNPITYCFMNRKFRGAFLAAFSCRQRSAGRRDLTGQSNSTWRSNISALFHRTPTRTASDRNRQRNGSCSSASGCSGRRRANTDSSMSRPENGFRKNGCVRGGSGSSGVLDRRLSGTAAQYGFRENAAHV